MPIDQAVSRNFTALKLGAILLVVFGHFFNNKIPLIWVPVTVGLIIFSFSSGYFTSLKYRGHYNIKKFWLKKIERLGVNLFLINILLFILFLIQNRPGLWSWQTLVNLLGFNGFLNWFRIENVSPYGKGMWFFTLLIIFYGLYPLLEKLNKKQMFFFTPAFILASYFASIFLNVGHALWITACGFVLGVFAGKNSFLMSSTLSWLSSGVILVLMCIANFIFNTTTYNFFFILSFSIMFIYAALGLKISDKYFRSILFFSGCLLEIYLLHPYFSFAVTGIIFIDFLVSLVSVLILSTLISKLSGILLVQVKCES